MRILVAEDDAILADAVLHSLRQSGYAVDWVKNGVEADCALAAHAFDLLILDLGLPRKSGLDVLKRLRGRDSRLPVLILTGFDAVSHRVRGLDAGADDYLAKPFDLAELEARVRALTRRGMSGGPPVLRHGALTYDQVGRVARLNGEPLALSAGGAGPVEALLPHPRRVPAQDPPLSPLCGWGGEGSPNTIQSYVPPPGRKHQPRG